LLSACGGATNARSDESTAGGEEAAMQPAMRTTTPVPVPQPAAPREELSEPLQRLWTGVEEGVAIRPPDPPRESTTEAVQAWAQGPYTEWLQARRAASDRVIAIFDEVPDE